MLRKTFFLQPEGGALSVVLLGEIGTSVHISLAMLILQLKTCLIEGIRILIRMYIKTEPMMFYFHSSLSLFLPVSAQGFEYNDIYVTAQLQLPECKLMIANTASQCLLLLLPCSCCVVCVVASLGGQWRPRVVCCDTNLQNKVKTLGKSVKSRCSSFDLCLACTSPRCWHIP